MLNFVLGLIVGANFAIFIMSLVEAGHDDDRD